MFVPGVGILGLAISIYDVMKQLVTPEAIQLMTGLHQAFQLAVNNPRGAAAAIANVIKTSLWAALPVLLSAVLGFLRISIAKLGQIITEVRFKIRDKIVELLKTIIEKLRKPISEFLERFGYHIQQRSACGRRTGSTSGKSSSVVAQAEAECDSCNPAPGVPQCPDTYNRDKLRNSLAGTATCPKANPAAHHIFPCEEFKSEMGEWLCCCGIDLNGKENGVLLPTCEEKTCDATFHSGANTKPYKNYVNAKLLDAFNSKNYGLARTELKNIKDELEAGTLPINNAPLKPTPCP